MYFLVGWACTLGHSRPRRLRSILFFNWCSWFFTKCHWKMDSWSPSFLSQSSYNSCWK